MLKLGDMLGNRSGLLRITGEVWSAREQGTTYMIEVYEDLATSVFYQGKNGNVMGVTTNRAYTLAWLAQDRHLRDLPSSSDTS